MGELLLGALISAGVSGAISGAGAGISTAINRKRATKATDRQLTSQSQFLASEDAKSREEMEAQFARDNELAQSSLSRGAKAVEENRKGFAFKQEGAEGDLREGSLSGIQGRADQRKGRLFGRQENNTRRWGL